MKKKTCTRCKEEKPLDSFVQRKNVNKTDKVYYVSHCKACAVVLSKNWRKKNPTRFREYQRAYWRKKYGSLSL